MVGTGELEEDIKQEIKALGISDKVIFTGIRKDIPQLLSAMDVMVFPSLYEGMPNVIIEAQATGLPCAIRISILLPKLILQDWLNINRFLFHRMTGLVRR